MGENSGIQWTNHTFNPWEGCEKVSDGCKHCYAETRNERFHGGENWGPGSARLQRSPSYWNQPIKWDREAREAGEQRRVFCASLADIFEKRRDVDPERARLGQLIAKTPNLIYLLLTKRPENMVELARECFGWDGDWPANVWAGTTAENRETLAERALHLFNVPARVRFLSCEPLLESLPHLDQYLHWVSWVIVGGESGKGARPFHLNWARNIVHDCDEAGVPCFVKQMGDNARDWKNDNDDFEDYDAAALSDVHSKRVRFTGKGADPSEWAHYLRTRQFPTAARAA